MNQMKHLHNIATNQTAVAYYRVSTAAQEQSGLGLAAQQHSVERYASGAGLTIVEPDYIEVETGTNKRVRPQLQAAIAAARSSDSVLLIAKLDRLARNVHFISGLMESGVKFVAVDMPKVDNLTLHILAAVAEQEAKLISERTKAGLAAAKRSGTVLGTPENLSQQGRVLGAQSKRNQAVAAYQQVTGYIQTLRQDLGLSFPKIAAKLNSEGHTTRTGKQFHPATVKRILDRLEA